MSFCDSNPGSARPVVYQPYAENRPLHHQSATPPFFHNHCPTEKTLVIDYSTYQCVIYIIKVIAYPLVAGSSLAGPTIIFKDLAHHCVGFAISGPPYGALMGHQSR